MKAAAAVAPRYVEAPFADALVRIARQRDDLVVLSADLSKYTDLLPFAHEFPDRFIQCGMAEANMMGIAGGLAKSGFLPIAVTYGVFATRRAYDQMAMAFATGPSRAIVVAFLPGITTPFRATHQAIDDLAVVRALPGTTVFDPADATEVQAALEAAVAAERHAYMRSLRGRVARIWPQEGFALVAREVVAGDEIGLIGTGLGTVWAMEAAALLDGRASVLHLPMLKPFDLAAVSEYCSHFRTVTTIENHSIIGGLGSAVSEAVTEAGVGTHVRRLGVPDAWPPAGSIEYIRQRLGLDAEAIARAVG